MTKPAARKGDKCTGHPGAGPRVNDQGSPDVFINGRPAHRVGDHWVKHSGHDSRLAEGSPTVFVNGKGQGRKGDRVACGSLVAEGSPDVFVGEAASVPTPLAAGGGSVADGSSGDGTGGTGSGRPTIPSSGYGSSGSGTFEPPSDITEDGLEDEPTEELEPDAPVTASDLDWMVCCMMDEARGENTPVAWAGVARVILNRRAVNWRENRQNPSWEGTIKGIVLASWAFSGFWETQRQPTSFANAERIGLNKMKRYQAMSLWAQMKDVAEKVIAGTFQGNSEYRKIQARNCMFYANLRTQPRPKFLRYPNGAVAAVRVTKIENHTYFRKVPQ